MLLGFVLFTGFVIWFFICAARYWSSATMAEAEFRAQYRPYWWVAKDGLVLCAIAWCWALLSSVRLLRQRQTSLI